MEDVSVDVQASTATKRSHTDIGYTRVTHEFTKLNSLQDSPHVPRVLSHNDDGDYFEIVMERIEGENAKEWLHLDREWNGTPLGWPSAKKRLSHYVVAEMDLLNRGAHYRDLNLEHLIFQDDKAVLIDHEATILSTDEQPNQWPLDSFRGTWETMAPEEFSGRGILTMRTATYRVAVIAHLALTGKLPFQRLPLRREMNEWRQQHPPIISQQLPKTTSKVLTAALARKPTHRHKNPESFMNALGATLDSE